MSNSNYVEIDFSRLLKALWRRIILMVLVGAVAASVVYIRSLSSKSVQYMTDFSFYIADTYTHTKTGSVGEKTFSVDEIVPLDANAVTKTCQYIIQSRAFLEDIQEKTGLPYPPAVLKTMIRFEAASDVHAFRVTVTGGNEDETLLIAEAVAEALPEALTIIEPNSTIHQVDTTAPPSLLSPPSQLKKIAAVFIAGFLFSAFVVVLVFLVRTYQDTCIHKADELEALYPGEPVLVRIQPEKRRKLSSRHCVPNASPALECYRRLRTRLDVRIPENKGSRIIGVAGFQPADGSSSLAFWLAASFAEQGKRVLLIDGDMRSSQLADLVGTGKEPGLGEFLREQVNAAEILKSNTVTIESVSFDYIPSGSAVPHTAELFSSERMHGLLEKLNGDYDRIVFFLPPIGTIVDTVSVLDQLAGILLVLRENTCPRTDLADALSLLRDSKANILGFAVYSEDAK